MKLLKRIKKGLAMTLALTMLMGIQVTTMATDYDNHWAKSVIAEWSNYGVVEGYGEDNFKPNASMTRAEFATVLARVFGLKDAAKTNFTDVAQGAWYSEAIGKVVAAGMMQGSGTTFNPQAPITRQEAAVALVNAYNLSGEGTIDANFSDESQIAAWATQAVETLASYGYINGRTDGKFDPKGNITRAEVVKMLDGLTTGFINAAGTYTTDQNGNVVINTPGVVLKDMTITGNLYLAQGIGTGDVTLDGVTVEGQIFVAGGSTVTFNKATVKKPIQVTTEKEVKLVAKTNKVAAVVAENAHVTLTGVFSEIVMPGNAELKLVGATVDKVTALPTGETDAKAKLAVDSTSTVKEVVLESVTQITGAGKIETLVVKSNGSSSSIKPGKVVNDGKFEVTLPSSTGGGGGGGGGTPTTPEEAKYIQVESMTLNGTHDVKGITVGDKEITVDLDTVLASLPDSITEGSVKFKNLAQGETVTVRATFSNPKNTNKDIVLEKTVKVGANGTITYNIEDKKEVIKANLEQLIAKINNYQDTNAYKHLQTVCEALGLELNSDYLQDGNIDTATLKAKINQAREIYNNPTSQELADAIDYLTKVCAENGITLTGDSITGKVTVETAKFGAQEYTVTLNF